MMQRFLQISMGLLLAVCVGMGFGYAAFGMVSIFTNAYVGARSVFLEIAVAIAAATLALVLLIRLRNATDGLSGMQRAERAIWRLAHRRGGVVSLHDIEQNTLLDNGAAQTVLKSLAEKNEATQLADGRWKISSKPD